MVRGAVVRGVGVVAVGMVPVARVRVERAAEERGVVRVGVVALAGVGVGVGVPPRGAGERVVPVRVVAVGAVGAAVAPAVAAAGVAVAAEADDAVQEGLDVAEDAAVAGGGVVLGGGDHGQEGLVDGDAVLEVDEHELQLGEVEEVAVDGGDDVILGDQFVGGRLVVVDRGGCGHGARDLELVRRGGWHNVLVDRREPEVCSDEDVLPLGAIAVASTSMEASTKPAANTPRMLTVVLVRERWETLGSIQTRAHFRDEACKCRWLQSKARRLSAGQVEEGKQNQKPRARLRRDKESTACSSRPPFEGLTDVVQVRANERRRAAMS